jgi:fused-like protein
VTLIIIKSRLPDSKKIDILKNANIPNIILGLLKSILKIDGGKNNIDFISDIIKTIGLLAKCTFDKNVGIEMVYLRSFLPLLPLVAKTAQVGEDITHQNLITNLVKTIGIFANNASANHIRSFNFYKDLVEVKFIQDCVGFLKQLDSGSLTIKFIIQVFSVLMHPVYGDISTFPWKRATSTNVSEFNECATMFECVRQSIMNCLFEIDWINLFVRVYQTEDEASNITKISILRILLQSIRQSKEFIDRIVNEKQLMKLIFGTLTSTEPLIYSTCCIIIAHLLKYFKEKKKEKVIEATLGQYIPGILDNLEKLYHVM